MIASSSLPFFALLKMAVFDKYLEIQGLFGVAFSQGY
jgi:hypothetical protein